jgi:hypothetical protein
MIREMQTNDLKEVVNKLIFDSIAPPVTWRDFCGSWLGGGEVGGVSSQHSRAVLLVKSHFWWGQCALTLLGPGDRIWAQSFPTSSTQWSSQFSPGLCHSWGGVSVCLFVCVCVCVCIFNIHPASTSCSQAQLWSHLFIFSPESKDGEERGSGKRQTLLPQM